MALVRKLERLDMERNSVHGEVECTYSVFQDDEGNKYLQLDTYGSPGRALTGKKSQTIQLDYDAATELMEIIGRVFE